MPEGLSLTAEEVKERYDNAVENFIGEAKKDVNVIAVVIQGSLANDVVWEKSDIDATVIIRDQSVNVRNFCIDADGIVLNAAIMTRTAFVRMLERSEGGLGGHSYYSKAHIAYTTDDSLITILEENRAVGEGDAQYAAVMHACETVCTLEKCQKWLYVKNDLDFCRYYILHAADSIARVELCKNRRPILRESIQEVAKTNPALMEKFYTIPLSRAHTRAELELLIDAIDDYLSSNLEFIAAPFKDFLSDGEIKTVNMFCRYFRIDGHFLVHLLDYLSEKGCFDRVSQTIRLTPKSRPAHEEVAYITISN